MTVILVYGDKDWFQPTPISTYLEQYDPDTTKVIHDNCKGVNELAGEIARNLGMNVQTFIAEWDIERKAGPLRNRELIVEGKPDIVSVFYQDRCKMDTQIRNLIHQAKGRNIDVEMCEL